MPFSLDWKKCEDQQGPVLRTDLNPNLQHPNLIVGPKLKVVSPSTITKFALMSLRLSIGSESIARFQARSILAYKPARAFDQLFREVLVQLTAWLRGL